MRRFLVLGLVLAALPLAGCINWQAGFDEAARNECRNDPGADRQACLDRVAQRSRQGRPD